MTQKTSTDSLIDTSKMSRGQRAALEMAEGSRDQRALSGFAASLFDGHPEFVGITPFPEQATEDCDQGNAFLKKLDRFLRNRTDPDTIDLKGEIPDRVIKGLGELGAFGIKIPHAYGGLGLSQTNYSRSAMLLGRHCGNLAALLSAHQSIGVPQPLLMFGTEAQKKKYLPLFAKGQISAFALTEQEVGSDPARMQTHAELNEAGTHYILNGEKLWCTNSLKASHIIVIARTPQEGKRLATTAFIVAMEAPGVEIVTRCRFMGLKALYNGVLYFHNVEVPVEDVVHEVGKGLKVALTTLNTGRLTLPAACTGMMQRCQEIVIRWSKQREQWGQAIGKHAAIAAKIADIAADTFATESMVRYTSSLVDHDKYADIRLEAAMSKLWGSEAAWHTIDQTMQIKGGRGYEIESSLINRGEVGDPIERMMRDCRINTIFEGSSEIMRLFIAREALDPHLRKSAAALDSRQTKSTRLRTVFEAARHYAKWYPKQYVSNRVRAPKDFHPALYVELIRIDQLSRKLSRQLFHSMLRYGPKLEKKQLLLGRLVDIGTELFAMSCACARANQLNQACEARHQVDPEHNDPDHSVETAKYICSRGRQRIATWMKALHNSTDQSGYHLAQNLMEGPSVH
jgi:alkylation response protein AidB-like acyl-CoA dehydrogenase